MDKIYIKNDLSAIVRIIYDYLEPAYICILNKKIKNDGGSFACTAHFFNNTRHQYNPEIYKDKCYTIHNICETHCKAYPILIVLHNESERTLINQDNFIHFPSKRVANFIPNVYPNIKLTHACCDGKGWGISNTQYNHNKKNNQTSLVPYSP